jgi:hypothetical protein
LSERNDRFCEPDLAVPGQRLTVAIFNLLPDTSHSSILSSYAKRFAPDTARTTRYLLAVWLLLGATTALAGASPNQYPKEAWSKVDPGLLGWSPQKLAAARTFVETLPPSSVVVIDHGREVAEWRDAAKKVKISSMRKSLLSALYGIYTPLNHFDLDAHSEV